MVQTEPGRMSHPAVDLPSKSAVAEGGTEGTDVAWSVDGMSRVRTAATDKIWRGDIFEGGVVSAFKQPVSREAGGTRVGLLHFAGALSRFCAVRLSCALVGVIGSGEASDDLLRCKAKRM